jgi:hypothetical protein
MKSVWFDVHVEAYSSFYESNPMDELNQRVRIRAEISYRNWH